MHGKYSLNKEVQLISGLTLLGQVEHLSTTRDLYPRVYLRVDSGNSA